MSRVRRVALVSVHTSPLAVPGTGDAGGMNVYVAELAAGLAATGREVDVFTAAAHPADPSVGPLPLPGGAGRAFVHQIPLGTATAPAKEDLPALLPGFAAEVLRRAGPVPPGHPPYDVVHGHYWLSGEVAAVLAAAWHVPLVQTMHTLGAVKNEVAGGHGEPAHRLAGERRLAGRADALIANTAEEAAALRRLCGAPGGRVEVVPPGVDTALFHPLPEAGREAERRDLGVAPDDFVVLFVGRLQPHKGPDLLLRAVGDLLGRREDLRGRLRVVVLGGPSGDGVAADLPALADSLGIAAHVTWGEPVARRDLARWYRAADVLAVPSRHESFGLVALEAQASGTPVVATRVGGLVEAVADGVTGLLVPGRRPQDWAAALQRLIEDPRLRAGLAAAGVRRAAGYDWDATAARTVAIYERLAAGTPAGVPGPQRQEAALQVLTDWLTDSGLHHARGTRPGEVVAVLPGERRRATSVSLLVGRYSVSVSAFVCRRPDESEAAVHSWLLRRNARLPGVAFVVDRDGDVYLMARVPVTALLGPDARDVVDELLGAVTATVEAAFDEILARGFPGAIRSEHAWRVSRGLPVDNLAAFSTVLDGGPVPTSPDAGAPPSGRT